MFNELLKNVMNLGIITEDDVKRLTSIELMMLIIERTNGLLNHVEIIDEELVNLLENIRTTTIEELNKWCQDGTFDDLINQTALKEVNDRLDEVNAVLDSLDNRKANITVTNSLQDQINALVLSSGNPESSSAEIAQARAGLPTLSDNLKRIENGKYPFDDNATLIKNGTYLNRECIKFLQLSNVDITRDYYIQQLSNYTFAFSFYKA